MGNPFLVSKQRRESAQNPSAGLHSALVASHTKAEREYIDALKAVGIEKSFQARSERVVTATDLFNSLGYSGLDSVGLPSTVWCAHGFALGASVEVDVGSFFMPGFGSLSVSASAKGERLRELMLCLVRGPTGVLFPEGQGVAIAPVCLMAMRGVTWTMNVQAAVSAGLKAGFTVDANQGFSHNCKSFGELQAEEAKKAKAEKLNPTPFWEKRGDQALEMLSIGAEASVTATLGGSYEYDLIQLRDARPTFYASPSDEAFRSAVVNFFGPGSREGIKARAARFFTDQAVFKDSLQQQAWYVRGAKLLSGGRIPFSNLVDSFAEARKQLDEAALLGADPDVVDKMKLVSVLHGELEAALEKTNRKGSAEKKALKGRLDTLFADDLFARWRPARHFFGGNPSLAEYKSGVEDAKTLAEIVTDDKARQLASQEVDHHLQVISAFQDYVKEPRDSPMDDQSVGGDNAGLCFIDISGHKPGVQAGIEAKIDVSALGGALGAGASSSAKASKQWKFTTSRFQQYGEVVKNAVRTQGARRGAVVGRRSVLTPVVTTQDTTLRYSQTLLSVSGKIEAVGTTLAEKSGTKVFNELSYESATVRWVPPEEGVRTVKPLAGTGYAFGQSMSVPSLLAAYDSYLQNDELNLLQAVVDRLGVPEDKLREVLQRSWVFKEQGLKDLVANGVSAVLLEATYYAPLDVGVAVGPKDGAKQTLQDFRQKLIRDCQGRLGSGRNLESIRIRYRHADSSDSRSGFKLGIPIAPVKIGIELEAVTKAGHSGIVDLQTWWFNNLSETNRNKGGVSAGRDDHIVPPTTLFHQ